jgi:hypothetical protein
VLRRAFPISSINTLLVDALMLGSKGSYILSDQRVINELGVA